MLQREFYEGYKAEFLLKDLRNVLNECERMDIVSPGTELAYSMYEELIKTGGEEMSIGGLLTLLEKKNKCELKKYDI